MRQRIVQERVVAFELLDCLFLAPNHLIKLIEGGEQSRLDSRDVAQTLQRSVNRIDLVHQWVVIPQKAGTGSEDVAMQSRLDVCILVEFAERSVEQLRVGVRGAQRQPSQKQS
jgi:hypothetical protein